MQEKPYHLQQLSPLLSQFLLVWCFLPLEFASGVEEQARNAIHFRMKRIEDQEIPPALSRVISSLVHSMVYTLEMSFSSRFLINFLPIKFSVHAHIHMASYGSHFFLFVFIFIFFIDLNGQLLTTYVT